MESNRVLGSSIAVEDIRSEPTAYNDWAVLSFGAGSIAELRQDIADGLREYKAEGLDVSITADSGTYTAIIVLYGLIRN